MIVGYIIQCNWIAMVNYLNMFAHFTTLTQLRARIRSIPDVHWDGRKIGVVGRYEMVPNRNSVLGEDGVVE